MREKKQITNVINFKNVYRSHRIIKIIRKEYYKQIYAHEFKNLDEMNQFHEIH